MIDVLTHAFAAAFLIFWGAKMNVTGSHLVIEVMLYLIAKVAPVCVGLKFSFDLYARFMGWPV